MASDPHAHRQAGGNAEPLPVMDAASAGMAWAELSKEALAQAIAGSVQQAEALWREAGRISLALPTGDPRHAAGLQNLAASRALLGERQEALALFGRAQAAWEDVRKHAPASLPVQTARSSLFHFRLEQRHGEAFKTHLVRRYAALLDVGCAACEFSASLVDFCNGTGASAAARRSATSLHSEHRLARHIQRVGQIVAGGWPVGARLAVASADAEWKTPREPIPDSFQVLRSATALAAVLDVKLPA